MEDLLKKLKTIEPNSNFKQRSLALILATQQKESNTGFLEDLLKRLKNVEPDPSFSDYSKILVLASEQNELRRVGFLETLGSRAVISSAGVLAVMALLILSSWTIFNQKPAFASLDPNNLNQEVKNLDIQIKLSQAEYYEDSAKKIEIALRAVSESSKTQDR